MIDVFKYCAINPVGDIYIAVNSHQERYVDWYSTPYSFEHLHWNQTLRVYKYGVTLLEESRILIADNLIDYGNMTMKATDKVIILATGEKNTSFSPRFQVIDLLPNQNNEYHYNVTGHFLPSKVRQTIDVI